MTEYRRKFTRNNYTIEIRTHALIRAIQKNIKPHMIEATILGGKMKRFGRKRVKFIKKFKPKYDPTKDKVICVDEYIGDRRILITTIEWGH